MSRFFSKSAKVAPEPPSPPKPKLELHVYPSQNPIWKELSTYIPADEDHIDYTIPGPLAYELADLCHRNSAYELDSEKIMYFSEVTNYLLVLYKDGERIGFLMLDSSPGKYTRSKIWLVCVSSAEKGKQYSKILIDYAKGIAKSHEKTTIHLEALTRTVGEKVYEPQGFTFNSPTGEDMTAQLGGGGKRNKRTRKYSGRKGTMRKNRA